MKKGYYLSLGLLFMLTVFLNFNGKAQLSITTSGTNYTINFDATVDGVNNGQYAGTGFEPTPASGRLDSDAWATGGLDPLNLNFGETQITSPSDFGRGASNGGISDGGFWSFQVATGDKALGIQPTGNDWTPGTITFRVINNTGEDLTSISISYNIYVRNDGGRSNLFNFSYSSDNGAYISVPELNDTSAIAADASPAWIAHPKSTTITGISLTNGSYFYFRWTGNDVGGSGTRDEFALNDIVVNVTAGASVSNPSGFDASPFSSSQNNLIWTPNVSGDSVLIAYNTVNTFGTPSGAYDIDGAISGGGTVLYKGTGSSASHTGLPSYTNYYYTAWSMTSSYEYSTGVLDSARTYKPEPSEYPADFTTTANGITIQCDWTDATGIQLPDAYLIKISSADNITAPVDGTILADDRNLSDGTGALNVAYGTETVTFYRLQPSVNYFVEIYPYTNSGTGIDYKNDGTAPAGNGETQMLLESLDFETGLWGAWDTISLASNRNWYTSNSGGGAYNTSYYGGINGFGQDVNSNDWLVSPVLNLDNFINEKINFFYYYNFGDVSTELKLKYSTNYITGALPTTATWTEIPFTVIETPLQWFNAGFLDISAISGDSVYFAFQYLSTDAPRQWRIDEITITGEGVVDPSDLSATTFSASQIDLSWVKNLDDDDVLVAYNTTYDFGSPTNGTDYTVGQTINGTGTVIYNGTGNTYSHTALNDATTYYYKAWSKTDIFNYSPGVVDSASTYKFEPSEYPTAFAVSGIGIAASASWVDAAGSYLPDAYLLLISTTETIPAPVDGTPVANDRNLTDGSGAWNVAYGQQIHNFYKLAENTTYYLSIYPYSNSGTLIDYKTDGTAPTGNALTQLIINVNDMETADFGSWDTISVASNRNWKELTGTGAYGTSKYANVNGFGGNTGSNDWLISPSLNLRAWANEKIVFFTNWNYAPTVTDELKLKYSTDYVSGDPTLATWTELPFTQASTILTWEASGFIDLSFLSSSNVHIAFHHLSTSTTDTRSWHLDEIAITGEGISDPTLFDALTINANQIDLSWTKNSNNNDVLVAWNSVNAFGNPEGELNEGSEIPEGGTVVYKGPEQFYSHSGLNAATKYYYKAWSVDENFTYSAGVVDSATTQYGEPSNYPTGFAAVSNSFSQITVSWTDSDAAHYLVKGSIEGYGSIIHPVDLVGEADGPMVKNVLASAQSVTFNGLAPNTPYYFKIFPYNGTGGSANYKTDDPVPQVSATTSALDIDLIITEVTDPQDVFDARFVELLNTGTTMIDFSLTPVCLSRQANGAGFANIVLTGSLAPGDTYVVGYSTVFNTNYGFAPDLLNGAITGNGDDGYFLYYGTTQAGILIDAYGVIGQDGTGFPWEYLDTKAVRKRNITSPNTTWTASEWVIVPKNQLVKDMTPGYHNGTVTWQGTSSSNWNAKGTNWDSPNGYIPDASCNVIVPYTGITIFPIVTVNSACNSVELQTTESGSATLNISAGKTLQIVGE